MKGYGINERHAQDPIGSHEPRGKDTSERKHRNDGGWTGTESKLREQALRQFMKNPEGSAHRDLSAYFSAYDEAFGGGVIPLEPPLNCIECDYVATTNKEFDWHKRTVGHALWDQP